MASSSAKEYYDSENSYLEDPSNITASEAAGQSDAYNASDYVAEDLAFTKPGESSYTVPSSFAANDNGDSNPAWAGEGSSSSFHEEKQVRRNSSLSGPAPRSYDELGVPEPAAPVPDFLPSSMLVGSSSNFSAPPLPTFISQASTSSTTLSSGISAPLFGSSSSSTPFTPAPLFPNAGSASSPMSSSGGNGNSKMGWNLYGSAQRWMMDKGYGWLMEVEDDEDDDDNRPLLEELDINFMDIFGKVRSILLPYGLRPRDDQLTAPDFWGPFFIVLLYAILLVWGQFKAVSWVFTVWVVGSFLLYFLCKVLGGGEGGLFEVLSVTGYAMIPLVVLCVLLFLNRHSKSVTMTYALKVVHVLWCSYAAKTLLVTDALRPKQYLLAYPVILLYTYLVSFHSGVQGILD